MMHTHRAPISRTSDRLLPNHLINTPHHTAATVKESPTLNMHSAPPEHTEFAVQLFPFVIGWYERVLIC